MTAVHSENNNEYFHEIMVEAKKGDMYAQAELGYMLKEGSDGAVKNEINAMKWYLKSAEQGLDSAQYDLGRLHYRGRLYNKGGNDFYSYKEAVKWFTESAKQGYIFSQIKLGDMYAEGRGINENEKEAFKWYLKAANNPPYNSMAFLPVGKRYYIGSGVDKDYKEAIKWLTKAIDSEDNIGVDIADARYVLGAMINNGHGIEIANLDERDKKSVSLFIEAADMGHKNSYALLKRFANEENNAQSQLYLAQKHYSGHPKLSIDEDLDIAYSWYLKAANNGNSDAQYALGAMYLNGEGGVPEHIFSAYDWIKEAANNGNLEAKSKIKEVTLLKQKAELKRQAEIKRKAELKRQAEIKRKAELKRQAEIKRKVELQQKKDLEKKHRLETSIVIDIVDYFPIFGDKYCALKLIATNNTSNNFSHLSMNFNAINEDGKKYNSGVVVFKDFDASNTLEMEGAIFNVKCNSIVSSQIKLKPSICQFANTDGTNCKSINIVHGNETKLKFIDHLSNKTKSLVAISNLGFEPTEGKTYTYYKNHSCTNKGDKICINFEQYKQLCNQVVGVSGLAAGTLFVYNGVANYLYNNGSLDSLETFWSDDYDYGCRVEGTVSGILNGSSRIETERYPAQSFILGDDGLLVYDMGFDDI